MDVTKHVAAIAAITDNAFVSCLSAFMSLLNAAILSLTVGGVIFAFIVVIKNLNCFLN